MTAVVEAPPTDLAPRTLSNDPAAFPPPTGREEEWRFTPLDEVRDFFDVHARPTLGFRSSSPLVTVGALDDGTSAIDLPSAVARSLAAHAIVVDIPDDHVSAEAIDVAATQPPRWSSGTTSDRTLQGPSSVIWVTERASRCSRSWTVPGSHGTCGSGTR
jgi:hypothetical protein